jgi:hypothetical protein
MELTRSIQIVETTIHQETTLKTLLQGNVINFERHFATVNYTKNQSETKKAKQETLKFLQTAVRNKTQTITRLQEVLSNLKSIKTTTRKTITKKKN